jgi:hypothetical protein
MSPETWQLWPVIEPWASFLEELDGGLSAAAELHCIGGFALDLLVNTPRVTADIDAVEVISADGGARVLELGGPESDLARKHMLYVQLVTVVESPNDYESRLLKTALPGLTHLRVCVLDPYDLLLTKAQRNSPVDLADARLLVDQLQLERDRLERRFGDDLRPYLAVAPEKTEQTVRLWLEELFA